MKFRNSWRDSAVVYNEMMKRRVRLICGIPKEYVHYVVY